MIITEKSKYKEMAAVQIIASLSNVDLLEEVKKFSVPESISIAIKSLKKKEVFTVKNWYDLSFNDMLKFWDGTTEQELIGNTAEVYLGVCKDKIPELPLIDFLRLVIHAKDSAVKAAEQFATIKRNYTNEEIQAGILEMKGSDFDIIDRYILRMGIVDHNQGYDTSWIIIFNCFKKDFEDMKFQDRLHKVYESKNKHK